MKKQSFSALLVTAIVVFLSACSSSNPTITPPPPSATAPSIQIGGTSAATPEMGSGIVVVSTSYYPDKQGVFVVDASFIPHTIDLSGYVASHQTESGVEKIVGQHVVTSFMSLVDYVKYVSSQGDPNKIIAAEQQMEFIFLLEDGSYVQVRPR